MKILDTDNPFVSDILMRHVTPEKSITVCTYIWLQFQAETMPGQKAYGTFLFIACHCSP